MFHSALLAIKPTFDRGVIMDTAIELGKREGWHISACSVIDESYVASREPVPLGAGAFKAAKDAEAIKRSREAAHQIIETCAVRCSQNGVSWQSIVEEGDAVHLISQYVAEAWVCQ